MRLIIKNKEPKSLTNYKNKSHTRYNDMDFNVKQDVKKSLLNEQGGLCAYCMTRISITNNKAFDTSKIEHFKPQSKFKKLELDYNNMLLVCSGKYDGFETCDTSKKDSIIKLNPTNYSTLINIRYKKNWRNNM